jgi:hypothetical protein
MERHGTDIERGSVVCWKGERNSRGSAPGNKAAAGRKDWVFEDP